MVLNRLIIKKINDYVYVKPRTVQEISMLLKINWRTADRYIEKISKETGSISIRTFRKGTRGALKVVFWSNIEKVHSNELQEKLFRRMESGKKTDFSPFDIYQFIPDDKRNAVIVNTEKEKVKDRIKDHLKKSDGQVLSFSGNLSWVNMTEKGEKLIDVLRSLAKRNVSIKIVTRVSVDSMKNVNNVLKINDELGKKMIEIRHAEQPLRGFIIDDVLARFREMIYPIEYEKDEIDKNMLLFYEIYDNEWIEWLQKIFWHMFRIAIPAEKRMRDLNSIINIYTV